MIKKIGCIEISVSDMEKAWGGRTAIMLDPDSNVLVLTQTS